MSRYTLSGPALQDIATILAESAARFGTAASERYERLIATALVELAADPARPWAAVLCRSWRRVPASTTCAAAGAVPAPGLARSARLWYFVLYRVLEPDLIGVARILHDSMDLPAHAADDFGKG